MDLARMNSTVKSVISTPSSLHSNCKRKQVRFRLIIDPINSKANDNIIKLLKELHNRTDMEFLIALAAVTPNVCLMNSRWGIYRENPAVSKRDFVSNYGPQQLDLLAITTERTESNAKVIDELYKYHRQSVCSSSVLNQNCQTDLDCASSTLQCSKGQCQCANGTKMIRPQCKLISGCLGVSPCTAGECCFNGECYDPSDPRCALRNLSCLDLPLFPYESNYSIVTSTTTFEPQPSEKNKRRKYVLYIWIICGLLLLVMGLVSAIIYGCVKRQSSDTSEQYYSATSIESFDESWPSQEVENEIVRSSKKQAMMMTDISE
ncbi:hypothetical protein ACOME3_009987 [Neoechinorhynchus agilis]